SEARAARSSPAMAGTWTSHKPTTWTFPPDQRPGISSTQRCRRKSADTRREDIMTRSILATAMVAAVAASCAHSGPPPPLTRDRERESLEQAVRWKNPSVTAVMTLAGKYMAAHRNREGYEYFAARSKESPDNMVFVALEGMFQARMAP